jgi:hypothetical protein
MTVATLAAASCGQVAPSPFDSQSSDAAAHDASSPDAAATKVGATSDAAQADDGPSGDAAPPIADAEADALSPSDAPDDVEVIFLDACVPRLAELDASREAGRTVLTAEDVTCEEDTDCTIYACVSCGDPFLVGVNDASAFECIPPPCLPPRPPYPPGTPYVFGYVTQTCDLVTSLSGVGVRCIDGQCRTMALSQ